MKRSLLVGALGVLAGMGLAACGGATVSPVDNAGTDAGPDAHDTVDAAPDFSAPPIEAGVDAGPEAEAGVALGDDCCAPPPPPQVVAPPSCAPAQGTFTSAQSVTLADTTPNATIFYTLDHTNPSPYSQVFSTPLAIDQTTEV